MSESEETGSIDEPQVINGSESPNVTPLSTEVENKDENSSSTENDTESESESEYETLEEVPDSQLYVIMVDGKPEYHVESAEEADLCMWHVARRLVRLDPDYTTRYVRVSQNSLVIERHYNWFLVAYQEPVHRLSYHKVSGIRVDTVKKEKEE